MLFVASGNSQRRHEQYWEVIDLAVEIISPDDPDRDIIDKRKDYAAAGVQEYWLIDPRDDSVTVLALRGDEFQEANRSQSRCVPSHLLDGFQLDVERLFREARSS